MSDHQHVWCETGKQGLHVDFTYMTRAGHRECRCPAIYVRCECGQIGFRKPGRRVVYTWARDE